MTEQIAELRDKLLHRADLPFTSGHLKWLSDGCPITQDAFRRVTEVQIQDYFKTNRADGSGRLRASGFGQVGMAGIEYCERKHILSFLGIEQDPFSTSTVEIMNTGTQLHYYFQQAGLSAGWLADIEVPVNYSPWRLRGSMDGLMADGSGLEIKTTNSTSFSKVDRKRKDLEAAGRDTAGAASLSHLWQIHMYMEAAEIEKFSLVYIDRGWPSRFIELRVTRDEQIAKDVTDAMERLMEWIVNEELPPMLLGCQQQSGKTYENCSYRTFCPTVRGFA